MMEHAIALALLIGYLLDLLLGDPAWLYHPVRLIGKVISLLERVLRRVLPKSPAGERFGGLLLIVLLLCGCGLVSGGLLWAAFVIHPAVGLLLEIFLCYQLVATKALKTESMRVYTALKHGSLKDGRRAVSMIVGRDTAVLDEAGVTRAAVETVAENASDGVIAPLLYMALGGPVLMLLYKAINTMDSMLGYKNERYLHFGRYPAKLDDVANFLPSRISAWMLIAAAYLTGLDGRGARRVFWRDRFNHASPNSAQTESVMAGALGVQLAGNAYYFGKLVEKPTIGDATRAVEIEDIRRANRLLYAGSALATAVFFALRLLAELLL